MGDCSAVVRCDRIESLASLPKSQKKPLVEPDERGYGYLLIHVEGHEYLAARDPKHGIQVSRIDLDDLPRFKRIRQAIVEFFTHQLHDFFHLRGVGTRASRIASMVEGWTRYPDGTEDTRGPALLMAPSLTKQMLGAKHTTSEVDYVDRHLRNHCNRQIDKVQVTKRVALLNAWDRACRRDVVVRLFRNAPPRRPLANIPELNDAACEAAVRDDFRNRSGAMGGQQALDDLMVELGAIARKPCTDDGAVAPPAVYQARLLLLGRALSANQRTPAQGLALLNRLKQGDALHDHADNSEMTRQCWQVARLMAGTEWGFRLLCELIQPPPGLPDDVKPQWRAALKIYLEAADHLIARCEGKLKELRSRTQDLESNIRSRDFISELASLAGESNISKTALERELLHVRLERVQAEVAAFQSARNALRTATDEAAAQLNRWCGAPLMGPERPHFYVPNSDRTVQDRLAHRALHAAAKLLQIRDLVDTDWLDAQSRDGADLTPENGLYQDDVMALAIWRNGFREDGDRSALAEFDRMLDKLVDEWLPREEYDPETGEVRHRMNASSPIALALGNPLTGTMTRRPVTEQSEDYHAAVGQATRLLVLQLKVRQGLPLRPYETLLKEALDLRDAIGTAEVDGEAMVALDGKFDAIFTSIDNAARVSKFKTNPQPLSAKDRRQMLRRASTPAREALVDVQDRLAELRDTVRKQWPYAALSATDVALPSPTLLPDPPSITDAVRASLLMHWLRCTEHGLRWDPYPITQATRNAVIGELVDCPHLAPHQQSVVAELKAITRIDFPLLSTWAKDAGLLLSEHEAHASNTPVLKAPVPRVTSEATRRYQRSCAIIAAIRGGGDKVDIAASFHGVPTSRDDFRRVARARINVNLGSGAAGEVTTTGGIHFGTSVGLGHTVPVVPGAPAIAFSSQETTSVTQRFAIIGSSVGGHTVTASEKASNQSQLEVGLKASGTAAVGLDAAYVEGDMLERGIALRFPPTPGSRDWVQTGEQTVDVVFGKGMARDMVAINGVGTQADKHNGRASNVEAMKAMCWQRFHPLMNGSLALNVFWNRVENETISAGASASLGASVAGDDMVSISANMRVGLEVDRVLRQSRVDQVGSTRLEVHGIGTGSRRTASLKVLANLLPTTVLNRLHSGLSLGTLAGISVTYAERGIQHFIRQETRDGIVQPSLAWDIVYRFVDDLIAHLNQPAVQAHWKVLNDMQLKAGSEVTPLDRVLQIIRLHASHSNQSYMVRRLLKADRLDTLNATTAMIKGLHRGSGSISAVVDTYALVQRCHTLLESDESYELGGVGVYLNDREEMEIAIDGSLIQKRTESASVSTEMLWFSARLQAPPFNNKIAKAIDTAETDASIVAKRGGELMFHPPRIRPPALALV
jgi:hypothetical protein